MTMLNSCRGLLLSVQKGMLIFHGVIPAQPCPPGPRPLEARSSPLTQDLQYLNRLGNIDLGLLPLRLTQALHLHPEAGLLTPVFL
jgi:hypothetical protein